MRLLVITDLHQKKSGLSWINAQIEKNNIEAVLFLGDVTDMGTAKEGAEIISGIKSKVYFIPGNCDPRDIMDEVSKVAVDMHGKKADLGGHALVGIGGSNVTPFGTPFELTEDELYNGLKKNASEGMILMTHCPSLGILDKVPDGPHVGSAAIKRIVDEFHPILALSGHIHEDIGLKTIDGTVFCNPGPAMNGYCAIVDIDGDDVKVTMKGPTDE